MVNIFFWGTPGVFKCLNGENPCWQCEKGEGQAPVVSVYVLYGKYSLVDAIILNFFYGGEKMFFRYGEKKGKYFPSKRGPLSISQISPKKWNLPVWIFLLMFLSLISIYKAGAQPLSVPQISDGDHKIQYNGILKDQGGNILAGVKINLISNKTGSISSTITSETGDFSFSNLPPGKYDIEYELEGSMTGQENVDINVETIKDPRLLYVPVRGGSNIDIEERKINNDKKSPKGQSNSNIENISLKTQKTVISENLGLNKIIQDIAQKNNNKIYSLYYSKGSIFAKNGIAMMGNIEKQLNKVTAIPYKDEDYIINGLKLEEKGVYCIRLGGKNEGKLIIRVLKINTDNIEVEYHIVPKQN